MAHMCTFCFSYFNSNTVLATCILRKANGQRRLLDLFFEQVLLIKEEDGGRISEPLVVANGVKQIEAFFHAILQTVRHDIVSVLATLF